MMNKSNHEESYLLVGSTELSFNNITQIRQWVLDLPQGDSEAVLSRLFVFIEKFNQQHLDSVNHYQVLSLLAPVINQMLATLKKPHHQAALPLSGKTLSAFNNVHQFLQSLCVSYKSLINQLAPQLPANENAIKLLCLAIFHLFHYSSLLLVECYLVYMKPEKGFWERIHRTYQLAIKYKLHQVSLKSLTDTKIKTHISSSYKKLLILASVDPLHLMQTEILKTFLLLEKWSWYAKFVTQETFGNEGGLLIELDSDTPSQSVANHLNLFSVREDTLYLSISDIAKVVRTQMQKITLALNTQDSSMTSQTTFSERASLSMYLRLSKVLGSTHQRSYERKISDAVFLSVIGLSTCHRLRSDNAEFTPEKDEIALKKGTLGGSLHLTLMPKEHTPWIAQEMEKDIVIGVVKPRESHFEEEDIWKKKRATEYGRNVEQEEKKKEIVIVDSLLMNSGSASGLAFHYAEGCGVQARVGELISFKDKNSTSEAWSIGFVKWVGNLENRELNLGVEILHGTISAVAVKAVSGVGEGSEYFRALLVVDADNKSMKTIITPGAVYDSNTILLMHVNNKLRYISLKKLLKTSAYCSQFLFEGTTDPEFSKVDSTWV